MATEKKKDVFYHIRQITEVQDPDYMDTLTEEELKEFNIFLLQKFLALSNDLVYAMTFIDKYVFGNNISKKQYYALLIHMIPKGRYWLNFNKNEKGFVPPAWFLNLIKEYFIYISKEEALTYFYMMNEPTKAILLKKFGIKKEKIKELIPEKK